MQLPKPPEMADVRCAPRFQEKTLYEAYLLWIPPFGLLGGHHYYLRRYAMGALYSLTLGFLGVGLLVDLFRMPLLVREANAERYESPPTTAAAAAGRRRSVVDAYLCLLPPFGLLGLHHFYLGRHTWGAAYFFTLGFLGLGFLFDLVYLPFLVRDINAKIEQEVQGQPGCLAQEEKSLASAYVLSFPPLGWFGFHQLYLGNMFMFIVYLLTLGLCGVGWLVDLFRMPVLVRRCRERAAAASCPTGGLYPKVYADDAYVLLLPFGVLGLHHFYLRRYAFGAVYALTLGLGGVGVLVDLFLIPTYVRRCNAESEAALAARVHAAQQQLLLQQQQQLLLQQQLLVQRSPIPPGYCAVVLPSQPQLQYQQQQRVLLLQPPPPHQQLYAASAAATQHPPPQQQQQPASQNKDDERARLTVGGHVAGAAASAACYPPPGYYGALLPPVSQQPATYYGAVSSPPPYSS